ncbi:MAG: CCA tRNA nucleotidyltransferase [Caulobacteraceae bacterium]
MPKTPDSGLPDRLPIAPWMSAPSTRAVIGALEARGGAGCARFVGGCVRNVLVGRDIDDIDIATVLTPDEIMAALTAAGLRYVPTGVEHGTVTAIAEGRPYEVTTLRRDVETDGRRAVVAYTRDWAEDAERRDLRLNALYMDADGLIYDPTGAGVADALAGRIVFVGEAESRIREDYLRILRFFRFRAWFGRGAPDAAGLAACAALKGGLERLSAERVSKELLKLLAAEDPREAAGEMAEAGVLAVILPEARPPVRLNALVEIERSLGEKDAELRLAALLPGDPAVVGAAAQRLRLSNAQRERLEAAAPPDPAIRADMTPAEARRRLYVLGARAFEDRLRLAWAERGGEGGAWLALLRLARAWVRPKFPLTGHDAAAAGLAPGPQVGEALRRAEAFWVEQDFQPGREVLLDRLKG